MLDSVNLERRGIPSVTIVTEPFVSAARAVAVAQGVVDLPLVVIPHDYLPEDGEDIRRRIEPVVEAVIGGLFGIGADA